MVYLFGVLFGTFWGTAGKANICNLLICRKYIDFMSLGWGTRICRQFINIHIYQLVTLNLVAPF